MNSPQMSDRDGFAIAVESIPVPLIARVQNDVALPADSSASLGSMYVSGKLPTYPSQT